MDVTLPAVDQAAVATLLKRARAKFATVPLAARLADVAQSERQAHERRRRLSGSAAERGARLRLLEASYRATVYCVGTLSQDGARLTGRWCGNRWCLACARIRSARAWARYEPHVTTWPAPHFVTLTAPNVAADALRGEIERMQRCMRRISDAMRRKEKLVALRKLECTYSVDRDDYHPHYHLIVAGSAPAHDMMRLWLRENTTANAAAQDVRPADEGSIRELFKYFTKLSTGRKPIHALALDVIFRAMRQKRTYQPMGFTAPVLDGADEEGEIADDEATQAPDSTRGRCAWMWNYDVGDWIDPSTGEVLSGYTPGDGFRAFAASLGTGRQPGD